MMTDGVMLLSGGIDSVVLAYYLHHSQKDVVALTFDYGQKARRELQCARWVARKLGFRHEVVKLPKNLLKTDSTVIPNRNMILLSMAVGYALSHDIERVYFSAHRDDWLTFPDCRPEFVQAMNVAVMVGNQLHEPVIVAPFLYKTKVDIVRLGVSLGVPFERTWSCYGDGKRPCGKCIACKERRFAFRQAGVKDPL